MLISANLILSRKSRCPGNYNIKLKYSAFSWFETLLIALRVSNQETRRAPGLSLPRGIFLALLAGFEPFKNEMGCSLKFKAIKVFNTDSGDTFG